MRRHREQQTRRTETDRKRAKTGDNAGGVYQDGGPTPSVMRRLGTILMAVALVSGLLAVPLGVSAVTADEPNPSVAPGERLAGVIGIQEAEVDGDLSERSYEARLDRAQTDAERAAIVDERRAEIERRLADHEADLADLRAAREAGNITEGTYRARVATLAAETASTERAAGRASETASQLPAAVRDSRGISVESLQRLRANASDLGGAETAAIARDMGGPNTTRPADGPMGGPATPHNRTPSDRGMPATDDRPAEPGDRPAGDRPVESEEQQTENRHSAPGASPGDDGGGDESRPERTDGDNTSNTPQRGPADEPTRQNDEPTEPPASADRQGSTAGDTDDRGSNSQRAGE